MLQRTRGAVALEWAWRDGRSRLVDLRQEGALRVRMPRVAAGQDPEAVMINTAGGLTGGDRLSFDCRFGPESAAWLTGQASEKVYRALDGVATQQVRLHVGARARAVWLPQPLIMFEDSAFERSLEVDLEPSACLFALEATILGRAAMGERVTRCRLGERWRVRRGGRLVWASEFLLADARALQAAAALAGARAFATFVYAAPNAVETLSRFREIVGAWRGSAGVSAPGGVIVGTLLAADADALMEDLRHLVEGFFERPMPRVWTC